MGGEQLPAELDPKQLVEQEGPNKGNIADVELAQVGAEMENKQRDFFSGEARGYDSIPEYEIAERSREYGQKAMNNEVWDRADAAAPEASRRTRQELSNAAVDGFKAELEAKADERKAEDEAKAAEIIEKLRGEPSE
jgi:hypothetical protein